MMVSSLMGKSIMNHSYFKCGRFVDDMWIEAVWQIRDFTEEIQNRYEEETIFKESVKIFPKVEGLLST